jgi:hypothetical protein
MIREVGGDHLLGVDGVRGRLKARLNALYDQDQALAHELATDTPSAPDTTALRAVADQLDHTIAHGEPEQAKALLAILIAELRVNSRNEILPTYRVGAPMVARRTVQWS